MYIYDRELSACRPRRNEQAIILRPSHRPYHLSQAALVMERYRLGQNMSSPASFNQPGVTFDPQSNYILARAVMDAAETLLSTPLSEKDRMALGSKVNPLMVERVLTIFRYDDGRLQAGLVKFGAAPQKETITGSITSSGSMRYPATPDLDLPVNIGSQAFPWLCIHTHPTVNPVPAVPSGIERMNNSQSGDLYFLHNGPKRQIGIMTIGLNSVIVNFRNWAETVPFSLAIRDPIKGPTDFGPTRLLDTHKAAATALRLIFRRPTVTGYYTGDLRTGIARPYLSAHQQKKLTTKTGR